MSNYEHLNLEALRLIVLLSEGGGLSYAAFELEMPISSASYKLQKLEEKVGLPLLCKDGRSLTLTTVGFDFVGVAKIILEHNDRFFRKVRTHKLPEQVVIGISNKLMSRLSLPTIRQAFASQGEEVRIQFLTDQAKEALDTLELRDHAPEINQNGDLVICHR